MGGNRVHSFSSLLKNLCTLKIPDEITPQINKRLATFPLFFFIHLFRLQRKPFVRREGIHTALCPEPTMVINPNYLYTILQH